MDIVLVFVVHLHMVILLELVYITVEPFLSPCLTIPNIKCWVTNRIDRQKRNLVQYVQRENIGMAQLMDQLLDLLEVEVKSPYSCCGL